MNEFERRWKSALEAARRTAPALPEEAPFCFSMRVVAQWKENPEPPISVLWQQLALRVLGAMAVIFVCVAAYSAFSLVGDSPLQPPVENAVSETCWLL